MSENQIKVTITLSDPQLKEDDLQEAVQNLKSEVREIEGVTEADLIPIQFAPPEAKGVGGFILGQLKAVVNPNNFKTLVGVLSNNLFGRTLKIKAEGNGKKIELSLSRPEDIDKIMPQIDKFINK